MAKLMSGRRCGMALAGLALVSCNWGAPSGNAGAGCGRIEMGDGEGSPEDAVAPQQHRDAGDDDGAELGRDPLCPTSERITADDIEQQFHWAPPGAVQSVCNQGDIDNLKALFVSSVSGVKYSEIKTVLGATCSACVFSPLAGAGWQVFVEQGAGTALDNRRGSCFTQLEGALCGKAQFQWEQCLETACSESDCGEFPSCQQTAMKGACSDLTKAYVEACPNLDADEESCSNVFFAIVASCGGGSDAGIDGAPP